MAFDTSLVNFLPVRAGVITDDILPVRSSLLAPETSLVNPGVNADFCDGFLLESYVIPDTDYRNRVAVGFRLNSDFGGLTGGSKNDTPVVWDIRATAVVNIAFPDLALSEAATLCGLSVWLHTGTVSEPSPGYFKISGGRAVTLANSCQSLPIRDGDLFTISTAIDFHQSLIIDPSFVAFNPLPLCVALVVTCPGDRAVTVTNFAGEIGGRMYTSQRDVFLPNRQ